VAVEALYSAGVCLQLTATANLLATHVHQTTHHTQLQLCLKQHGASAPTPVLAACCHKLHMETVHAASTFARSTGSLHGTAATALTHAARSATLLRCVSNNGIPHHSLNTDLAHIECSHKFSPTPAAWTKQHNPSGSRPSRPHVPAGPFAPEVHNHIPYLRQSTPEKPHM
jgi:hypothetical protein